jgi:hypothetical protein
MTRTDLPTMTVTSPAELVAAVPYLLGFHPHESLVAVGLDHTRVVVTARINLPNLHLPNVPRTLFDALTRASANKTVIILFTDTDTDTGIAEAAVSQLLTDTVQAAGLEMLDLLLVTGGRWRSLLCQNTSCCPAEGTAIPAEPTLIAAAAIHAGLQALPNREALAAMFEPIPESNLEVELRVEQDRQLQVVLTGERDAEDHSVVEELVAAQRAAQARRMPPDEQVARFAIALQGYPVRDAMWLAIDDGQLPGAELWVNLARRLPRPYDAAPLFLAAWSAYRDGNGAVAGIAAELALVSDPDYSAAGLLLSALRYGVDPRTLPKLSSPVPGGDDPTPT